MLRVCMLCIALLVGISRGAAQDTTLASPKIITSGVRTSRISNAGTFEIQGIRLQIPTVQNDTTVHPRIEDVTLRMVKNSVLTSVESMKSVRIEIDRALYIPETDSYTVRCYVANVSKPIASGTLRGSCTLELSAVAAWNGRRSAVASKTFVVTVAN